MNDITAKVSRRIENGKDLSLQDIQIILSVLHGKDDLNLLKQIQSGEIIPYRLHKKVIKYITKLEPERPSRNTTETRNMFIAYDYIKLKKTMKRNDVLLKLQNESATRYGTCLNAERIIDCITGGKKSLKSALSHSDSATNEAIIEYIENNPDVAKRKLDLFDFLTEDY